MRDSAAAAATANPAKAQAKDNFTIGDLSREFGITPRALRFFEEQGLIAPARRGQQRLYGARERARLRLILRGKRLGFSLKDIADILDLYRAPAGEAGQIAYLLEKIRARREELLEKRRDLDAALADLDAVAGKSRKRLAELTAAGQTAEPAETPDLFAAREAGGS
jgi:DNA-binding transcriptional MerR regulator